MTNIPPVPEGSDPVEHNSSNTGGMGDAGQQADGYIPTAESESSSEVDSVSITEDEIATMLQHGEMLEIERLPYSSNYNLLVLIRSTDRELPAVYKPRRGENPLWDFASGTLCQREVAAYAVNSMLGWSLVPPTVLRDGLHGIGSVQLYIEHDDSEHYFTVQEDALFADIFRQIALFDFITNNADRKSGHCLIDHSRRLWAIDHGICFHSEYKLRTVIWEFSGKPIDNEYLEDMGRFYQTLLSSNHLHTADKALSPPNQTTLADDSYQDQGSRLAGLLSPNELNAMQERTLFLLTTQTYPEPLSDRRNYPWPPV